MLTDWAAWERMEQVDEKRMLKAEGLVQVPHLFRSSERAGDTRASYEGRFASSQNIFVLMFGTCGAEMFPSLVDAARGSSWKLEDMRLWWDMTSGFEREHMMEDKVSVWARSPR